MFQILKVLKETIPPVFAAIPTEITCEALENYQEKLNQYINVKQDKAILDTCQLHV